MKLHVGSLRRRVARGAITPEEMETCLADIEQEINATAMMAQDVQASGESVSPA